MKVRASSAALLTSLLFGTGWAKALDGAGFEITGVVVSERGGGPVAGAHITATASGQAVGGRRGFPRRGRAMTPTGFGGDGRGRTVRAEGALGR